MKIVVLDGHVLNPGDLSWAPIERFGALTVFDRTPPALVAERIGDAEIVFTNKSKLPREVIERAENLRFIGTLSTGFDVVDLAAARERGIPVCNVPGYGTDAVAQGAFALLLEITNTVGHHNAEVHKGRWAASEDYCFWDTPLIELAGKTFGVLGCGSIGSRAAAIASAFGMRVIGYQRHPHEEFPGEFVSMETLFRESDVLSLHCPATPETVNIVNAASIATMKDGAILLNTARGQLVDAQALFDALESGKLRAAGIDVLYPEPPKADNPLLSAKNCFITPHTCWAPLGARARLLQISADNLAAFLRGESKNRVN